MRLAENQQMPVRYRPLPLMDMAQGALSAGAAELSTPCEESLAGSTPVCVTFDCKKCGRHKPAGEFHLDRRKYGRGIARWCKECCREYARQYYREDRNGRSTKVKQRAKRRAREQRDLLNWFKGAAGCAVCGEPDYRCLDFHHRDPAAKSFQISNRCGCYNYKRLMEEVGKCDVLCANCHRKEHYDEGWSPGGGADGSTGTLGVSGCRFDSDAPD